MNARFASRLRAALEEIDRPGSFCVRGAVPAVLPGLDVPGVGPIALPLTDGQAKKLKKVCAQAPYGKGAETLVDTSVRRVWRLTPDRFSMTNPDWAMFVLGLVDTVQQGLGLERQKLEAHLYDLLLYEPGSFFLPHTDGEKLARMVATLVIVLPSAFQGGELIVRHDGHEETIAFGGDASNQFRVHYAAFYADCEHEVRPLTKGHRLCLVYNLTLAKGKGKKGIAAPKLSAAIDTVAAILGEGADNGELHKLVVTLEHQYTQDGLTWDALKGADAARASVLLEATRQADWKAYLALLTYHVMGSAEYADERGRGGSWSRSRYDRFDDDEDEDDEDGEDDENASNYVMSEVIEEELVAEHWRDRDGNPLPIETVDVDEKELLDPDALRSVKPQEDFEGYTGNAGMTLDRWYRHGAILLWPSKKHFEVLCDAGRQPALAALGELVAQWQKAGKKDATLRGQVHDFAVALLARWVPVQYYRASGVKPQPCPLARTLALLEDPDLVRTYLNNVLAVDASVDPGSAIATISKKLGWTTFQPELEAIFAKTEANTLARNIRLLESHCTTTPGKTPGWNDLCASLARTTVHALETLDAQPARFEYYGESADRLDVVTDLARALLASNQSELLARVVTHALALPKKYPLREVHVPALLALKPWIGKHLKESCPALTEWVAAIRAQLEALTAREPQPPADFRRPAEVSCACPFCTELNRFLADPGEEVHRFSTAEGNRRHLADHIRRHQCDLVTRTEKRGSPHTLICTKNTASFERSVEVYHADLQRRADIRGVEAGLPTG